MCQFRVAGARIVPDPREHAARPVHPETLDEFASQHAQCRAVQQYHPLVVEPDPSMLVGEMDARDQITDVGISRHPVAARAILEPVL